MDIDNYKNIVLAIHYGHNCTVGLSINGKIVSMLSEERLCRIKNSTGFPIRSLHETVNKYLDGDFSKVNLFSISDSDGSGAKYLVKNGKEPSEYLDYYWKSKSKLWEKIKNHSRFKNYLKKYYIYFKKLILAFDKKDYHKLIFNGTPLQGRRYLINDHHLCHAASLACFEKINNGNSWLLFTLDGEGDGLSSTVNIYKDGKLKRISANKKDVSLGYLFSETTSYLGMKSNQHEFKLMGMAPYADPNQVNRLSKELESYLWLNKQGKFEAKYPCNGILPVLSKIYAFERFDVISGSIQKLTEKLISNWIGFWVDKEKIKNVGLSGGVFMNVKAAKVVSEMQIIDEIFVMPSASDESLPFGAIWLANKNLKIDTQFSKDLYLGSKFDDDYIDELVEEKNLKDKFHIDKYLNYEAANLEVANLLAKNEIVARCVGREEWGARALGNRSILCNASKFENIEKLNNKIKNRDFWMPFTPSILEEDLHKYIINPKKIKAPYMAITFESTNLARKHLAAAVHPRDFTMRPQEVIKDWNPSYHDLIFKYKEKTGMSGLLNTSFNLHGEPNVSSPSEAIKTVLDSGLEYVLINNYLFQKKKI